MWCIKDVETIINELEQLTNFPKGRLILTESKRLKNTLAQFVHVVDYSDLYKDLCSRFPSYSNDEFGLSLAECVKDVSFEICISQLFLKFATYDQLIEVMIHEYAHYCNNIYLGGSGHDTQFKNLVVQLGGTNIHSDFGMDSDPKHPLVMEENLYVIHCQSCQEEYFYSIKTKKYKSVLNQESLITCQHCGSKQLKAYSGTFICEY